MVTLCCGLRAGVVDKHGPRRAADVRARGRIRLVDHRRRAARREPAPGDHAARRAGLCELGRAAAVHALCFACLRVAGDARADADRVGREAALPITVVESGHGPGGAADRPVRAQRRRGVDHHVAAHQRVAAADDDVPRGTRRGPGRAREPGHGDRRSGHLGVAAHALGLRARPDGAQPHGGAHESREQPDREGSATVLETANDQAPTSVRGAASMHAPPQLDSLHLGPVSLSPIVGEPGRVPRLAVRTA